MYRECLPRKEALRLLRLFLFNSFKYRDKKKKSDGESSGNEEQTSENPVEMS